MLKTPMMLTATHIIREVFFESLNIFQLCGYWEYCPKDTTIFYISKVEV